MSDLPYYAEAVPSECIHDTDTPDRPRRRWRVAFYRHLHLYAVIPMALTKSEAEAAAKMHNKTLHAQVENYIRAAAGAPGRERPTNESLT